ncbi:adenosylcobinamide-phosphate synthase CbiB [Pseudooceanicola sp.]|uniref:adenosylcobinamide-phosphate synthase CbiB n=1 Tax=Pseudooceanicola sp. TaxID=1914328 RepID=UPI002627FCF3|nr:adenosylcobinamide-phosphate synthase CbiB [Pseudooceanicola sp.]MDF1855193.1 adenosylcobinamide-phosphate synthase CbiB [Pseudooceanicola sp.]
MSLAAILCLALILDAVAGEPEWLWSRLPHPAVLMGRAVTICESRLNQGRQRILRGGLALALLVLLALTAGSAIAWLGPWAEVLGAAILLAQRSLCDHVSAVAAALRHSTEAARIAVARIVGRDTAGLDDAAISRAAIESAAENFSDGVVAPAFWFLIGGLPGLAAYKMVNTADSMIGYRTPRYEAFGKLAARTDDLMNLIPARLSALLIALLTGGLRQWPAIRAEARRHRSPNAGWPEAAMARAVDTALSGPRAYDGQMRDYAFVHPDGTHSPGPGQIEAAVQVLWRVWAAILIAATLAALLVVVI